MVVPLLNFFRIAASGAEIIKDRSFVKSMSRGGEASELLLGPSFYTLSIVIVTACFWRTSLTSCLSIGILCGGDGMADIIGRRFGRNKLPYNSLKTIEGSLAMFLFGSLLSIG